MLVTILDDSVIRHIASWGTGTVATSMYLDVDGLQHPRWPDVEQRADRLFRSARRQARERAQLAASGTETEVAAELTEIRTWLQRDLDRSTTRGIALFSRADRGLFETVELRVPVRDQVVVDPEPDVAQLCVAAATSWSALAVAVDRERWRVVRLEPDGRARELDVLEDKMARTVDIDMELAGFGRHEEELAREHFRRVARGLTAEMVRDPARYLVVLGTQESVAELEGYLPRFVADRIAGHEALPGYAGVSELAAAARLVVERAEQERRAAVLITLRQRAAATGTSVVTGLTRTLEAVGAEQVATLVVERTFEAPGGRCDNCRLLVAEPGKCPRCGAPVRGTDNVVDAAIAEVFLHHGALEPVEDGALSGFGRIGALVHPWAAKMTGGGDRA